MNISKKQVKEEIKNLRERTINKCNYFPADHHKYATEATTALGTLYMLRLITQEQYKEEREKMYIAAQEVWDKIIK